jgi:hypothetical protein
MWKTEVSGRLWRAEGLSRGIKVDYWRMIELLGPECGLGQDEDPGGGLVIQ